MQVDRGRSPWEPAQTLLRTLVVVAPHLLGGVHAASTLGLAVATCGALGLALWATRGAKPRRVVNEPVADLLAVMLGVTALHALPLGASLASRLAPASLEHAAATAMALGHPSPNRVAFTLDPGGTHERILFSVVVFAAFCSARLLPQRRHAALLASVAVSTIMISISDLLHRLFAASRVYWIYTPQFAAHATPLLNPNNLAGFMSLGFPICLGFAVQRRGASRWAWLLGAAVIAATNLLAGSRGGTVALVGAAALFGALHALRPPMATSGHAVNRKLSDDHRNQRSPAKRALIAVPLTVFALMLAGLLASLAAEQFVDTDYSDLTKLDLYRAEWIMLLRDPTSALLGVGRGGFSASFSAVNPWAGRAEHAESLPLQYAIEFGLPLGTLLVLGAGMLIVTSFRRWRAPAQLGGLVGVSAISLQNLADFSLELSGIALPAAVCLAAALPTASRTWLPRLRLRDTSRAGLVFSVAVICLCARSAVMNDANVVQARLADFTLRQDREAFWALFDQAAAAHPAEPALTLLAANQRLREHHRDAPLWINRTMALAPAWGGPHILAAHWLASKGRREQALAELRAAAEIDPDHSLSELCAWIEQTPTAETVMAVVPRSGAARIDALDLGARCLGQAALEADEIDTLILNRAPRHVAARLRRARRQIAAGRWEAALEQARAIQADAPTLADVYQVEAESLLGLNQAGLAAEGLQAALPRVADRKPLLMQLAWVQSAEGNEGGMRETIDQLRMASAGNPIDLANASAHLAECEARLGNHARALKAMHEANNLSPRPAFLARAADLAAALGETDFALNAWEQLCLRQKDYCPARDALKLKLQAP